MASTSAQNGTPSADEFYGVLEGHDESIVFTGFTAGLWSVTSNGLRDMAAVSVNANATELWRWQVIQHTFTSGLVVYGWYDDGPEKKKIIIFRFSVQWTPLCALHPIGATRTETNNISPADVCLFRPNRTERLAPTLGEPARQV